jgi:hypothetical protein
MILDLIVPSHSPLGPPAHTVSRSNHKRLLTVGITLLFLTWTSFSSFAQSSGASGQPARARLEWSSQPGVTKYRLQIASDEQFKDVLFDSRVSGTEYIVSDLMPGRYYWRVAPAEAETGHFLRPVAFEVKVYVPERPRAPQPTIPPRTRFAIPGWLATTGEILQPMAAQLKKGGGSDFLGVNSEGTVYALDGSRGAALWVARYLSDAGPNERPRSFEHQFRPLVVQLRNGVSLVIVGFDRGVRALDGTSGREVWRTEMAGRAVSGLVAEVDDYAGPEI